MGALYLMMTPVLGLLALLVCSFLILYYWFPHVLIRYGTAYRQYMSGMRTKYVGNDTMVFCYAEKNSARPDNKTVLFLHGFSQNKQVWAKLFQGLPKDLHLLAIDMPGHGGSSIPAESVDLGMESIARMLNEFLDLIGLSGRKVHVVGMSGGASIVGLFAAFFPQRTEKVSMIAPILQPAEQTEFLQEVQRAMRDGVDNTKDDGILLLPKDLEDMKKLLRSLCYTDLDRLSVQAWKGYLQNIRAKSDFYLRMYKDLLSVKSFNILVDMAPKITSPSQLLWGKQDEIVPVSGADFLKSKLPNNRRVDLLDKCGHLPTVDRPGALMKCLTKFINNEFDDRVVPNGDKKHE